MREFEPAESAYDFPLLIRHLLHTPLARAPDQEIVSGEFRRYDYLTFRDRIGRLARALEGLGIGTGDTVAVMDWDTNRYLECFFAVPMMGAILHTINIRLASEQILYTINHAEDDIILVHQDFAPIIEAIHDRISRPTRLVYLSDEADPVLPEGYDAHYEDLLGAARDDFDFQDFDERTRATTFYTTGTTGDPKGVTFTHRQLVLHTMGILATLGPTAGPCQFHRDDVYMPMTPMFHVHAWGFPYAATVLGQKQVYSGRYFPATMLRLFEREGATFSHCVPTILHMLLEAPEAANMDFTSWKIVIGGAAMPHGLAQAALDRGIEVFTGYGMSETCPILTIADVPAGEGRNAVDLRCKTGMPAPLVDLRVVDAEMKDVQKGGGTTGEVVVRTPWLTQGYVGDPEKSEELWAGGYLHTGDVGYIDESGSLRITDRMKDVIKSGGEWISSLELESIASACSGVAEVAAIGIPDTRWGERPMLLIVGDENHDPAKTEASVRSAIQIRADDGAISKWAVPDRIEFVPALDKTSVGKLDKKVLRARYTEPAT